MKLRHPLLVRMFTAAIAAVLWFWIRSIRFRRMSLDGRHHPTNPAEKQVLYAFWHQSIFGTMCDCGRTRVLISQHADGEVIAQICRWLGMLVHRGSTTRGGLQAVQTMLRSAAGGEENLGITPDGPRGPRRKMQPGAVWIASTTGLPIVLIGMGHTRAWRMNSWDRFNMPVPFSGVVALLSQPIHVPANLDHDGLEQWRLHLEQELSRITDEAEAWATRIRTQGSRAELPAAVLVPLPEFPQSARANAA